MRRILLVLVGVFSASGALSQSGGVTAEFDERGAVLCYWQIMITVKVFGDRCRVGQDETFRNFVDEAISETDNFIITNALATEEAVGQAKAAIYQLYSEPCLTVNCSRRFNVCESRDYQKLYEGLRVREISSLRIGLKEFLSVPRKPVMNPCL